jgi:hypothetical protein
LVLLRVFWAGVLVKSQKRCQKSKGNSKTFLSEIK